MPEMPFQCASTRQSSTNPPIATDGWRKTTASARQRHSVFQDAKTVIGTPTGWPRRASSARHREARQSGSAGKQPRTNLRSQAGHGAPRPRSAQGGKVARRQRGEDGQKRPVERFSGAWTARGRVGGKKSLLGRPERSLGRGCRAHGAPRSWLPPCLKSASSPPRPTPPRAQHPPRHLSRQLISKRGKPRRLGRGMIARTAAPSFGLACAAARCIGARFQVARLRSLPQSRKATTTRPCSSAPRCRAVPCEAGGWRRLSSC